MIEGALPSGNAVLVFMVMTLLAGFMVGGLARWILPGPSPMSIGQTILLGIAGAIAGGLVAVIFRLPPLVHPFGIFLLAAGGAWIVLRFVKHCRRRGQTLDPLDHTFNRRDHTLHHK